MALYKPNNYKPREIPARSNQAMVKKSTPAKRTINPLWVKFRKQFLLGMLILLGVLFLGSLRHTQSCAYDGAIRNGQAVNEWGTNLCPNLLDSSSWGQFLLNAINPFSLSAVKANDERIGQLTAKVECKNQLDPMCLIGDSNASLKSTNNYTNILIVGIDSREGHSGIENTDSLMLISYHHTTGNTLLISFPRDLVLTYANKNGQQKTGKINAIYTGNGADFLDSIIGDITDKQVHYHLYLNVATFAKVVDELGGITINLDKEFKDVYPCSEVPAGQSCPSPRYVEDADYGYFTFPAGANTFNGFNALVYTRARKYSSDFDRAARQQKLVKALIQNVIGDNSKFVNNIGKFIQLYDVFKKDIKTNIELKDIAGALKIAGYLNDKVGRIVVDPNLDNGRIISRGGLVNGSYGNKFLDPSYSQFHSYLNKVWDNLPYYIDNPKVLIVNQSGGTIPAESPIGKLIAAENPYRQLKVVEGLSTLEQSGVKVKIYEFSDKHSSANDIQTKLPGSLILSTEIDGVARTSYNEDIVIYYQGE
jgi:LCP family protein required for cell wall assembly